MTTKSPPDRSIDLKHEPYRHVRKGHGTPAIRAYRADPGGINLQIWRKRECVTAYLPFEQAVLVANAIKDAVAWPMPIAPYPGNPAEEGIAAAKRDDAERTPTNIDGPGRGE